MQTDILDQLDKVSRVVEVVGAIAFSWLGLFIKNQLAKMAANQAETKLELIQHQNAIKDDLNEKHSELIEKQNDLKDDFNSKHAENIRVNADMRRALDVHIADDSGVNSNNKTIFEGISRTLQRIDSNVSELSKNNNSKTH